MGGLKEYQETSKSLTREKILQAVTDLKKSKSTITVKKVAEKAGVSESIIYKNKDLVERIRQAKSIQNIKIKGGVEKEEAFQSKKDKQIKDLIGQLERMKKENERLQNENALLLGSLEMKTTEVISLKQQLSKALKAPLILKG